MKNVVLTDSEALLRALSDGQVHLLETLYELHREDFFRWAGRRFRGTRQDFEDAWQEAVFAFYEQAASGKLTELRFSARTWLFAIGYRRLLNYQRKTKRIFWKDSIDDALVREHIFQQFPAEEPMAEEREMLLAAMETVSPQCKELLKQRFFLEKTIPEIQQLLNFQSTNALSVSLSRCLKRLKETIQKKQSDGHGR